MSALLAGVTAFLLLNIFAGMVRLVRGPTRADRMLAIQLFGTTGVAILVLLSAVLGEPALINIALVFAVLAIMAIATFVKRVITIVPEAD